MIRVLLVDDEEPILYLLSTLLETSGFAIRTTNSAREAIGLLAKESFDLVVTDLRMESPLAGFEVVAAARRLEKRPAIAVLTAFPVPTRDWKSAGADALFIKGANTLRLPQQLQALLPPFMQGKRAPHIRASGREHETKIAG